MILYEFKCVNGHRFDKFLSIGQRNAIQFCPECDAYSERIIKGCNFKLDGCSGDFPTAYDKWTNDYYKRLNRAKEAENK